MTVCAKPTTARGECKARLSRSVLLIVIMLGALTSVARLTIAAPPALFVLRGSFYEYGVFGQGATVSTFGPVEGSYATTFEFPDGGAADRSIVSTIGLGSSGGTLGINLNNESLLRAPRLAGNDHGGGITVIADVYVEGPPGTPFYIKRSIDGTVTAVRGGGLGTTQAHAAGATAVVNNVAGAQSLPVTLVSGRSLAGTTSTISHPSVPGYHLAATVTLPAWGFTYQGIDFCFPSCPQQLNFRSTSTLTGLIAAGPCCPQSPELDVWNQWPFDVGNNCYNYAVNRLSPRLTRNQPGGLPPNLPEYTCSLVANAAANEGLVPTTFADPNSCGPGECVVAMVIAPPGQNRGETDYHWYRRNGDGSWSHKQGGAPAKTTDEAGHTITNPQSADKTWLWPDGTRTPGYSQFCGYYCIPCEFALGSGPLPIAAGGGSDSGLIARVEFFSGRENPGWAITDSLEIEHIRQMALAGPLTNPDTTQHGFGYGGISLVAGPTIPMMPDLIRASDGVVDLYEAGVVEHRVDVMDLEGHLISRAIAAGLGRYVPSGAVDAGGGSRAGRLELAVDPNPTTTQIITRYSVPTPGRVQIDLFDVAGRRVKQVLDMVREPGAGSIRVDVADLPRGIYLVRMRTATGDTVQRVSILR